MSWLIRLLRAIFGRPKPEPPIEPPPVDPPPIDPPPVDPPEPPVVPRLYRHPEVLGGRNLCTMGTATPIVWRGVTGFRLLELIHTGREAEAIAYLDWCASEGINVVRVFTMCWNMFRLAPEDGLRALPRGLELAAARGLYLEVVAIVDSAYY